MWKYNEKKNVYNNKFQVFVFEFQTNRTKE